MRDREVPRDESFGALTVLAGNIMPGAEISPAMLSSNKVFLRVISRVAEDTTAFVECYERSFMVPEDIQDRGRQLIYINTIATGRR